MSNPTFRSGPVTFEVAEDVTKFRLVTVTATGIRHAQPTDAVIYGAATENGYADTDDYPVLDHVKAARLAIHRGPASVPLELATPTEAITQGSPIYAAADGKVAATGSFLVGVADRDASSGRVITCLITPAIPAAPVV